MERKTLEETSATHLFKSGSLANTCLYGVVYVEVLLLRYINLPFGLSNIHITRK